MKPLLNENKNEIEWPVVSVLIATFNSTKLLPMVMEALHKQTYPQDKLDVMAVDGGSTDGTLELAVDLGCRIVKNEYGDPAHAKQQGFLAAKGKYILTIDHDEVLTNPRGLELMVRGMSEHPECKFALGSGYVRPKNYPFLNEYISEFGDPFSLFIYNFPKGDAFFEKKIRKMFPVMDENDFYFKTSFASGAEKTIIELNCLGTLEDKEYCEKVMEGDVSIQKMGQLFYLVIESGATDCIFVKNDALEHYSADSFKAYWPKLRWRVCNNIHHENEGNAGFNGRTSLQKGIAMKKYLFIPYTILTIPALIQGAWLAATRKNPIYLIHPVLCWYVLIQIIYNYGLKLMGKKPAFMSYDGKKKLKA